MSVARFRLAPRLQQIRGDHVSPSAPFLRAWGTAWFPLRRRQSRRLRSWPAPSSLRRFPLRWRQSRQLRSLWPAPSSLRRSGRPLATTGFEAAPGTLPRSVSPLHRSAAAQADLDCRDRRFAAHGSTVAREEDGYDAPAGALAEWLGTGLQNPVHRFDSGRRLWLSGRRHCTFEKSSRAATSYG